MAIEICDSNLRALIKQWYGRRLQYINETYDAVKESMIDNDKNVKDYIELVDFFNYTHEGANLELVDKVKVITKETAEKIKESEKSRQKCISLADEISKDAFIAASIYQNEENIKKVLERYDIIDKDGKIIV